MLEAVARRKVRFARVLEGVPRQPREDLVTSAIFGNLRLLDHPGAAIDALLGGPPSGLRSWANAEAIDINLELWKRCPDGSEPDVVLTDNRSDMTLVEVK